jgi:hypothetical protein
MDKFGADHQLESLPEPFSLSSKLPFRVSRKMELGSNAQRHVHSICLNLREPFARPSAFFLCCFV